MPDNSLSVSSAYSAARSGAGFDFAMQLIMPSLRKVVPDLLSPTVLDLGCGYRNLLFSEWLTRAPRVIGIDRRAQDVQRHPDLDIRLVGDVEKSPLADCTVDMIVSSFVMEHVEDPLAMLRECRRVLKPEGTAVFCTPCLFGYKTLIARFSGQTLSNFIWKRLKGNPHPPWPDYYRGNTPGKIKELCAESGLVLDRLVFIPELPHFFFDSPALFALARLWDRVLEGLHLPILHNAMAYVLRRPSAVSD
jgi:SAM-dependent methyltransferase